MALTDCRHFNGYKPCGYSTTCDSTCRAYEPILTRILVIHLEALGAVLRATSILPALKRKYPSSHITWVTQRPAQDLLANHPLIDRILTTERDGLLSLAALHFDVALVADKSLKASGVLATTSVDQVFGFLAEPRTGAIRPANPEAEELWQLGLSNEKKFFLNQKPETQLLIEAMALGPFLREEYGLFFSTDEEVEVQARRRLWSNGRDPIVGINTGCSSVIPYKKLSVEYQRRLVEEVFRLTGAPVVLLGGPEDTLRNERIAHGLPAIVTPTERGLRDGLVSVAACDVVVTGDSLGMHMAIAARKWVVAWFGPTCAQEIDLYDRGVKVRSLAGCSPCWKRFCTKTPMCYDLVPMDDVIAGVREGLQWTSLSSKRPILATSSSVSP